MKQTLIFLLLAIPLFCMAQSSLTFSYEYDDAGNRVCRKTVVLAPPNQAPSASLDSTDFLDTPEKYFVEKIARLEIKIYPNPTTEKVTLEITNMEDLRTGTFKLFSLTGQLLQDQSVHSTATAISLAGLPKGTYILNVHINGRTEEWKVIKN